MDRPVRIFPELYDISDFLVKEHPILHPETTKYSQYWTQHEKRCLEGMWGHDYKNGKGGWRYMPGHLYYYVNFCEIADEDEEGNTTANIRPLLRDIEWMFAYAWATARGFSGFQDDEETTCCDLVKRMKDTPYGKLNVKFRKKVDKIKDNITKPDGTWKEYMDPYEYLKLTHPKPYGRPLYDNDAKNLFWLGSRGSGKDLEENTPVFTPKGRIPIKDIRVGDQVYGRDGRLTTVIDKANFYNQLQYKVTLDDGRSVECGAGHLWTVHKVGRKEPITLPLKTIYENYLAAKRTGPKIKTGGRKDPLYYIPRHKPIVRPKSKEPIDPYFVGLWLGDGTTIRPEITNVDEQIIGYLYEYAKDLGYEIAVNIQSTGVGTYKFVNRNNPKDNILRKHLPIGHKRIPEWILYGSFDQKLECLKGLMDADGYCNSKTGGVTISSSYPDLADDIGILLHELGIAYSRNIKKTSARPSHRFRLRSEFNVFKLSRKAACFERRYKMKSPMTKRAATKIAIVDITPTRVKPSVCIGVDNEDSLFLAGDYIVTHNSFGSSNMAVGHEFNFFGKRYFDDNYLKRPSGVEIFVGSAIASKSQDFLDKFEHTQEYLKTNVGAWGSDDDFIPGYFSLNTTGSLKPNAKSIYRHEYRYKQGGTWTKSGSATKIHHGTFTTENPQAAVGTRPTVIVVEEAGLCHNLLEVHAANETAQIRRNKFGSTLYIGTGGNIEKIVEPQIIFEDPEAYSCVPFPDVWENRMKPIGFFLPSYYVDNDFKDEQGNTNVEAAFEFEMQERKKREESRNSHALDGYIMARPIKPSEMFLTRDARIFPVTDLRRRIAHILGTDLWKMRASIGDLSWTSKKEVRWVEDTARKRRPIMDLNIDKLTDIRGSIVVYEHPDADTPVATYQKSLYKVVYDPVKDDEYGTSLASVLVYKGYPDVGWNRGITDNIVAEYIGRYDNVEKIHDIVIRMAMYYKAKVLVETNINDFVRYCKRNNLYHMLQLSPYEAITKAIANPGRKYDVGVQVTSKHLKVHCEQLIRSWLLQEVKTEDDRVIRNLDKIYSLRLLHELVHYNRKGNFDHVSSMMLLVLWLFQETTYRIQPEERKSDVEEKREAIRRKLMYQRMTRKQRFHVY